ncbi:hypothetical protein POSPLADRAFT_1035645 [Postia placenta MAD-698-R-SB12]|uniref:Thioredoxin domain-containing protein n=1 Tax=Postia placenta MAD-698-R-SB12 TaxID=670580 RepID=A0A1X6MSP2_9APHY|nr:hypothetical protein POSPLADRAFT_1035645 [Postia placenta MAD-698-R-SB12]OSX59329.1 hypothetical protein POSPLADRAFT_1035645 [Postia placenta MAD-698-R-SB12]
MKLLPVLVAPLALSLCASAQYFSEGWKPGQPVTYEAVPTAVNGQAAPAPTSNGRARFSFSDILTSGPIGSAMGKLGVNLTEKWEKAKAEADAEIWDTRIPLITDDNYDDLIVNEPLGPEEEDSRVWFMIISASKGGKNAFSMQADDHFDKAFDKSLVESDLPNVRFARVDYLNVTYLTTKWGIWQAPYLLVLTDRGQTMRFYKANTVRLDPDLIHQFLKEEGWREGEPWISPFAPGGQWEYIMHYYALSLRWVYDFLMKFPRWVLMIASAGIANLVMKFMHSNAGTDRPQPRPVEPEPTAVPAPAPAEKETPATPEKEKTNSSPAKGKGRQRKNARK